MSQHSDLVPYGIEDEESDYRLHVSFGCGKAYLFSTREGRKALRKAKDEPDTFRRFAAKQPGANFTTGVGYRIPWQAIEGCQEMELPLEMLWAVNCQTTDPPDMKGRKAMAIAWELYAQGLLSMAPIAEVSGQDMQIRGVDLVSSSGLRIQVKCDFWGGRSGLAIQTHEANPFRRY